MVRLGLEEMAQRSKYVVTAEVLDTRSYWGPFHDAGEVIFTEVKVRVRAVLKGAPPAADLSVTVLGGKVGGVVQTCLESARYEKGETVLLFLREYHGGLWNTGWLQGKYRLSDDGRTVRGREPFPIPGDVALAEVQARLRLSSQPPALIPVPRGTAAPPSGAPAQGQGTSAGPSGAPGSGAGTLPTGKEGGAR